MYTTELPPNSAEIATRKRSHTNAVKKTNRQGRTGAARDAGLDDGQLTPASLGRWSVANLDAPTSKIDSLRRKLCKELARRGETLEEISRRIGIEDEEARYRFPVIGVQTAASFLEVTRQRVNCYVETHGLGIRIDGRFYFSVDELVAFKLAPREPGRPIAP
ncbi:hypothetical protein [Bythopirellula polymerisocia]|uniref:hypothetical protein n=1 Tax=Bythopirellula polymerisocia TaxID=2528003 RepID=UPI0011B7C916|nr:hypothetical protein [Bythopirellula polymerisocia]